MVSTPVKVTSILFILIALVIAFSVVYGKSVDEGSFQVALDEASRSALERGEFTLAEGVSITETKDCEGTEWIKKQECSVNGKNLDGTEGSCGPGKEIWILDPSHSNFIPATGDGKCEPQERDCSVPCPKSCEGDTWKEGPCVRQEVKDGAIIKTILDGTEGKCGDGISQFTLDKTAPDFKPAVGSGSCVTEKGGACHVPCPEPEEPKCVEYAPGWQPNVGLGCVRSENDLTKVRCGEKGVKNEYRIPLDPTNCPELTRWVECEGEPCPIDCVGSWSGWSECESTEPCGVQPEKTNKYVHVTKAQYGGMECPFPDGYERKMNCGELKECCETLGDWAKVGQCNADGTAKYTQTYKEHKPGACPSNQKAKFMPCCYQKGDWKDITECKSNGKKTQKQTTINCAENMKTREVDCPYEGEWKKTGGCGSDGKQYYTRFTINSSATTTTTEDCCYKSPWGGWGSWGACNGSKRYRTRNRTVINCPLGTATTDTESQNCNHCSGSWVNSGERASYCARESYRPGAKSYKNIYHNQKYVISKNASNGGNACPHRSGETRTTTNFIRREQC